MLVLRRSPDGRFGDQRYAQPMSSARTPASLVGEGWVTLGEAIEEMVWIWSAATGRVLYANPAFQRFWGRDAADLGPGRDTLLDLVAPDDVERLRKARAGLPQAGYADEYK